jgi:hypothetical protein
MQYFVYAMGFMARSSNTCRGIFLISKNSRTALGLRVKRKVKAIPLQAWTGPEGSRGLRLPDFKTIGT